MTKIVCVTHLHLIINATDFFFVVVTELSFQWFIDIKCVKTVIENCIESTLQYDISLGCLETAQKLVIRRSNLEVMLTFSDTVLCGFPKKNFPFEWMGFILKKPVLSKAFPYQMNAAFERNFPLNVSIFRMTYAQQRSASTIFLCISHSFDDSWISRARCIWCAFVCKIRLCVGKYV